jgi:ribosomal 50S subunit-recycling heat shock protein
MRADLLLKSLCLTKSRSQARKGCEEGFVRVGGRRIKPGAEIREGDIIEIRYPRRVLVIEIVEMPPGQTARRDRERFYRVVRETPLDDRQGIWDE